MLVCINGFEKCFSVRPREGNKAGPVQAPRSNGMSSDNPNGWDPIFDGSIVSGNDFLAENNVTYQDLINKPIQFKILVQGKVEALDLPKERFLEMYERGVELGDYCIAKEQIWLNTFQLENFNERTMINWALDMDQIIDECMAIIKWAMKGKSIGNIDYIK